MYVNNLCTRAYTLKIMFKKANKLDMKIIPCKTFLSVDIRYSRIGAIN